MGQIIIWNQHFEFQIQDRSERHVTINAHSKIQPRLPLRFLSFTTGTDRGLLNCVCVYGEGKKWKGNIQLMDEVETNVSYEILLYFKRFERHLYKLSACLIVAKLNLFSPLVLDCCSICFCRTFISKVFFATATVPTWKVVELGKPTIVNNGKRRTQNVLNKKSSHCFRCKIHFYVGNAEVHTKQNDTSTISEKMSASADELPTS